MAVHGVKLSKIINTQVMNHDGCPSFALNAFQTPKARRHTDLNHYEEFATI
jgi:hypothetical protein